VAQSQNEKTDSPQTMGTIIRRNSVQSVIKWDEMRQTRDKNPISQHPPWTKKATSNNATPRGQTEQAIEREKSNGGRGRIEHGSNETRSGQKAFNE